MIPSDFARLSGRDLITVGAVLIGLCIGGLVGLAGVLMALHMAGLG